MKGYAQVARSDAFSAVIGFEVRMDLAKEIRDKGVKLYYEKHYVNGSWWKRLGHKNETPHQYVRSLMGFCQSWDEILHEVLDDKEVEELAWWCFMPLSKADPLRALIKATTEETIFVDSDMAKFINKYKEWLECVR